ncbi:hypothetical protein [Methylocapsa acidiphila]|uniref:hypothetical protein n=1 Tax=Methylocapsa acidiphila TaxID=133552 RepID=UPI00041BB684|nr:hypothetical protein [Methylocapsa acidiphila]
MTEGFDAASAQLEPQAASEPMASPKAARSRGAGPNEVIIHARFHPNGLINTINHRPEPLSPQEWFDRLCHAAPDTYQPLSGGRGAFRIPNDLFALIWETYAEG